MGRIAVAAVTVVAALGTLGAAEVPGERERGAGALRVSVSGGTTYALQCGEGEEGRGGGGGGDGYSGGDVEARALPHPDRSAACARLDELAAQGADPFAPVPPGAMCTMQYGGPEQARITGSWRGRAVDAVFGRANGCEIARWNRLRPVLPEARTGAKPAARPAVRPVERPAEPPVAPAAAVKPGIRG